MEGIILSIIFIFITIIYYNLLGNIIIQNLKIRNKFACRTIIGWIICYCLGWIVGFPEQILRRGWNEFSVLYSTVLFIFCAMSLAYLNKKEALSIRIRKLIKKDKGYFKEKCKTFLIKYWFVLIFTLVFTLFSTTNMMSYTINNYNDDYYIVKMVHMVHSNPILNENYFLGNPVTSNSIRELIGSQGYRIFNTYELIYSFFGTFAHIPLVYFAKVTMTFHNYFICFLLYQLFSSIFLDENKTQYSLLLFAFLLIPDGFAAKGNHILKIRMFENWRFQTAIYMGGSVVRVCTFPLLTFFSYQFFKGYKQFLILLGITCITLLSYQSTSISYIILFFPIFILGASLIWMDKQINKHIKPKNRKQVTMIYTTFVLVLFLMFFDKIDILLQYLSIGHSKNLVGRSIINYTTLKGIAKQYAPYYVNLFKLDIFGVLGLIPLLCVYYLSNDQIKKIISIMIIYIFLVFKLNKSSIFLSLISFDFYCIARMLTGIIIMIVLFSGIALIYAMEYIPHKKIIIPLISSCMLLSSVCIVKFNMTSIKKYVNQGDGMVKEGYSLEPLTANNQFLPKMFAEISNYFEAVPNGKYAVYSENVIKWKGTEYSPIGLLLASKKIMYSTYGNIYDNKHDEYMYTMNWTNYVLNQFVTGEKPEDKYHTYASIYPFLKKAGLRYILLTRKNVKNEFMKNSWKVVAGSNKDKFWLIKAPF